MRIITGTAKGRKLSSPKGTKTRPTSDRVREAIFSIVGDVVVDARVLDLYSGTGAMGLEALSRGAGKAVFVETDPAALRCLNTNIEMCRCRDRSEVVSRSAILYLEAIDPEDIVDLVFADPPYRGDLGTLTLLAISKHAKPLKRCLIILEHAPDRVPEPIPANLDKVDARKYGNIGVTFLRFKNTQEA
ncbi:MAG: 16S rRNA (guanine(966)-N(2))-methyltransferase RsmD [bacterium]|nr:16S rRNA (guanine(966)-N(2))-methyltransferase RsmD [bacterium]MDT8366875.1 16S rRNA (guanine(966)-N(2))-methyltransferase RsmD [bacterium]